MTWMKHVSWFVVLSWKIKWSVGLLINNKYFTATTPQKKMSHATNVVHIESRIV